MKLSEAVKSLSAFFIGRPGLRYAVIWFAVYGTVAGTATGFIAPEAERIRRLDDRRNALRADLTALDARIAEAKAFRKGAAPGRGVFVSPSKLPAVISEISARADAAGVEIKKIHSMPSGNVPGLPGFQTMPLRIEVTGDYPRVGDFVRRVSMHRKAVFFTWDEAEISDEGKGSGRVKADLVLSLYSREK